MAQRIQVRRDTAANWTSADPTLAEGEIGFETDTDQFKIGDGATAWTTLTPYYTAGGGSGPTVTTGAGAPSTTPTAEGDIYVDTTADNVWVAAGTASSSDWKQATGMGGGDLLAANNLSDVASAATARTNLGVDAAGTDNSTNVTLAGTPDYITIAGQVITRGQIDLTADVTGDLPVAEGGTGSSTASAARTALGVAIGADVQAHSAVLDATTASFTTADETKLDGIETAATADQSKSEIEALIDGLAPAGGSTGEVLKKSSGTDFDYDWATDSTGGGGSADLGYTAAPTEGTVTNTSGTNATIPAADATNAGLLLPAEKTAIAASQDATEVGVLISAAIALADHGDLVGLADDDHTQYHTDARGDARYDALGAAAAAQAAAVQRANHTGSQTASTISDFSSATAATASVTANTAKVTNATHTGDVTGATALTIAANAVTNAKLATAAANTVKANATASTAVPSDLAIAASRLLGRGSSGNIAALTVGSNLTLGASSLVFSDMAQATFKGRAAAAGTGVPTDLTAAQAKTALAITGADITAQREAIGIHVSNQTDAITTGVAKVTFRMPFAMTLTAVRASLKTASTSGIPTIDINEGGTTIMAATKLTIDQDEKTSQTAAVPAVISDTALADDAEMTIDIDVAGTGAVGLVVWLIGTRA